MTNDELVHRYKMALETISHMSNSINSAADASSMAKIALKEQPQEKTVLPQKPTLRGDETFGNGG
jgi:hypothetical protein